MLLVDRTPQREGQAPAETLPPSLLGETRLSVPPSVLPPLERPGEAQEPLAPESDAFVELPDDLIQLFRPEYDDLTTIPGLGDRRFQRARPVMRLGLRLTGFALLLLVVITVLPFGARAGDEFAGTQIETSPNSLDPNSLDAGSSDAEADLNLVARASDNGLSLGADPSAAIPAPGGALEPFFIDLSAIGNLGLDGLTGGETDVEPQGWVEPTIEPATEWIDGGNGVALPDLLLRIRFCESTNNYNAANTGSTARGAYQFLTKSWDWYGHAALYGVAEAHLATPAQQDQAALSTLEAAGARPWAESRPCWDDPNIDARYLTARPAPPPPAPAPTTTVPAESTTTAPPGSTTTTTAPSSTTTTTGG